MDLSERQMQALDDSRALLAGRGDTRLFDLLREKVPDIEYAFEIDRIYDDTVECIVLLCDWDRIVVAELPHLHRPGGVADIEEYKVSDRNGRFTSKKIRNNIKFTEK